jgi:hypothetical protein
MTPTVLMAHVGGTVSYIVLSDTSAVMLPYLSLYSTNILMTPCMPVAIFRLLLVVAYASHELQGPAFALNCMLSAFCTDSVSDTTGLFVYFCLFVIAIVGDPGAVDEYINVTPVPGTSILLALSRALDWAVYLLPFVNAGAAYVHDTVPADGNHAWVFIQPLPSVQYNVSVSFLMQIITEATPAPASVAVPEMLARDDMLLLFTG